MQGLLVVVIDPQIRFELPSAGNYPSLDRHTISSLRAATSVLHAEPPTSSRNQGVQTSNIRSRDREQSHVLFNILLIYS